MTDLPVRLTFPSREPGARKIMADGIQVGHALAGFTGHGWTAHLWSVRCDPHMGFAGEVKGASLRQMRERVCERLAESGPWWSETATRGAG